MILNWGVNRLYGYGLAHEITIRLDTQKTLRELFESIMRANQCFDEIERKRLFNRIKKAVTQLERSGVVHKQYITSPKKNKIVILCLKSSSSNS